MGVEMQVVMLCALLEEKCVQIRTSFYSLTKSQCTCSDVFKYVRIYIRTQCIVHIGSLDGIVKQHIMFIFYLTHK